MKKKLLRMELTKGIWGFGSVVKGGSKEEVR